jgi:RNA polymerase sigma-70 factor (ECF subfamily)
MTDGTAALTSPSLLRDLGDQDHPGWEARWRTFLGRYQPLIYGWSRRTGLGHDDAEEVTAAVLSKLVTALRDFVYDPSHRFRGWLKTLVENEVRSLYRQRGRRPGDRGSGHPAAHRRLAELQATDSIDELVEQLDGTLARDLRDAEEVTRRVQARVEPNTWQAFWLTAVGEESGRDVAGRLGMTVAAVYQATWRVGQMLRAEGERLQVARRQGGEP